MAVIYRRPGQPDESGNLKISFLYMAGCAIQNCLDEAADDSFVICVRFAASEAGHEEVIQCSSHATEKEALEWQRRLKPPKGLQVVEYLYGAKTDVAEALTWPA